MQRKRGQRQNRRTRTLLVFFVSLTLLAGGIAGAQDWQTFKYPADGFSAAFPSEPQQGSHAVDTPSGTVELRSYSLELDQIALFVGVCDYGAKAEGSDVDAMLEDAKNGALQNSSSHLIRESKVALGPHRGLEYESEADGTHYRARIFIVGTKLYQALVVYPAASPYEDAGRFLDSFQLLPRDQTPKPPAQPSAPPASSPQ